MNKMPSSKDLYENWFLKLEMNTKYRLIEFIHGILKEKNSIDNNKQILYLENQIEELKLNHEHILTEKLNNERFLLQNEITHLKDHIQSNDDLGEKIKKRYEEEIQHLKDLKIQEMNLKNKEIKALEYQLKQSSDVASILNRALSNKEKGDIHELLEIDNLRNYFPNEDIYDVSEIKGNGDINCIINNTNIMIECKNYSQNTIKKTFSSIYEKFINNFNENEKFHFGVLAFSYGDGIPVKLPNGKYTHSKNNNIELEFIGNRFVLIVPNSLENKSHNLIWSILIGMKMYKQHLTNKDPTNTKYKFKKAQEFLESFKKKIRDNTKLLKSIYESLYESMDEIDKLLDILFHEDSNTKDQLKDHENEILKVITYLKQQNLNITQQNIIKNKMNCQLTLSDAKLRQILKDNWKEQLK